MWFFPKIYNVTIGGIKERERRGERERGGKDVSFSLEITALKRMKICRQSSNEKKLIRPQFFLILWIFSSAANDVLKTCS